jgi:UDP-2,3-diacylglucosamine pyrophosphatase LpxH
MRRDDDGYCIDGNGTCGTRGGFVTTIDFPMTELPLFGGDGDWLDAIVISDLHLGSDNCQAKAAAAFLQEILDGVHATRRLIINGDVFDSIDFRRLKKTHWKVLSQIRHLSDKIEVIWIAGNHDGSAEIVSHLLGVRVVEEYVLSGGEAGDILIIHGHQFDEFINDHPILTWLADAAYWVLQKVDRTHYVARLAKARSKTFVRCADKIREGAMRRAAARGCSGVICGHSHRPEANTSDAIAYYNSGCWTELPTTYLAIRGGKVELLKYEPAESLLAV